MDMRERSLPQSNLSMLWLRVRDQIVQLVLHNYTVQCQCQNSMDTVWYCLVATKYSKSQQTSGCGCEKGILRIAKIMYVELWVSTRSAESPSKIFELGYVGQGHICDSTGCGLTFWKMVQTNEILQAGLAPPSQFGVVQSMSSLSGLFFVSACGHFLSKMFCRSWSRSLRRRNFWRRSETFRHAETTKRLSGTAVPGDDARRIRAEHVPRSTLWSVHGWSGGAQPMVRVSSQTAFFEEKKCCWIFRQSFLYSLEFYRSTESNHETARTELEALQEKLLGKNPSGQARKCSVIFFNFDLCLFNNTFFLNKIQSYIFLNLDFWYFSKFQKFSTGETTEPLSRSTERSIRGSALRKTWLWDSCYHMFIEFEYFSYCTPYLPK